MSYIDGYDKIARDERQLKAIIGVSKQEFEFLSELYEEKYRAKREEEYKERIKNQREKQVRKPSELTGKLNSYEKRLFMCLYYIKTYPTFDELGFHFELSRSRACERIHADLPVLQELLKELGIAPKREINTPEDWKEAFGKDVNELIADATERRHFRHKDNEKQKENYSGKKNAIPQKTVS